MEEFNYKKSLGQNFLKDNMIVKKIIDSADIDKDTLVIEIGPGQGALSRYIVDKAKFAIFYEIDDRLNWYLQRMLKKYDNFDIIIGDFLTQNVVKEISKYDYNKLYVISNLPYYITTPIVSKLINDKILPDKMILMMQKEVADRFSAKVGSKSYGAFTVFLNYYYNISHLFNVSRNCFFPRPKIDSTVLEMDLKNELLYVKDYYMFRNLVKDSFKYKRKNLRNNLKEYDLELVESILKEKGLDLNSRAEDVDLDLFVDISNKII